MKLSTSKIIAIFTVAIFEFRFKEKLMNREHAIATIESKDDAAIIAEITDGGVALAKDYLYSFNQGGKLYRA